jgi:lipopolysaccharide biosynthesis protein
MNWYNKKTYYELYGYAEENVIFPIKKSNRSLVIYTHFDKDNIIKDYVIISIKSLIELGYVIIFCTTSEKIINVDLPLNILYYKNNGPGSNFIIWYDILKKNIQTYKSQYDWIMLLNDSILFPINGLDNFKNTIDNMRNKSDFWSHWDSNNIHDHGISSQIEYNINVIDSLLEFYSDKLNKETYTKDYFIQEIEVKQTEYLISKNFRFNSVIPYTSLNIDNDKLFSFFHPNIFDQWIQRKETFAIKWKYMLNYLNLKKINNPILNYITRYITVDSN